MRICDMTHDEFSAFLSGVAKKGASEALRAVGLDDEKAGADIKDIRDLLRGVRVVKSNAAAAALKGFGRLLGWLIVISVASHFLDADKLIKLGKELL